MNKTHCKINDPQAGCTTCKMHFNKIHHNQNFKCKMHHKQYAPQARCTISKIHHKQEAPQAYMPHTEDALQARFTTNKCTASKMQIRCN